MWFGRRSLGRFGFGRLDLGRRFQTQPQRGAGPAIDRQPLVALVGFDGLARARAEPAVGRTRVVAGPRQQALDLEDQGIPLGLGFRFGNRRGLGRLQGLGTAAPVFVAAQGRLGGDLHRQEAHLALEAGRQAALGIGQGQAHAEGAAGGVEDPVDHGHAGAVNAADRRLGLDLRRHADRDAAVEADRHEDLDVQRVDLSDGHDRNLLVGVLPDRHVAFDHHALDRALDAAPVKPRLGVAVFQPRGLPLQLCGAQGEDGQASLDRGLVHRLGRDDLLRVQLLDARGLGFPVFQARPARLDLDIALRPDPGYFDIDLFQVGIESRHDLALLDQVATIDQELLEDTFLRAAQLDHRLGLHDAGQCPGPRVPDP